jgi:hypothetical protein
MFVHLSYRWAMFFVVLLGILTPLSAQKKKKIKPKPKDVWERFSYAADLKSANNQGFNPSLCYGMYSNRNYLEQNPEISKGLFGREMELVCLPVFEERQNEGEFWLYLCRIFPQQPNRPLTQFFNKIEQRGDSIFLQVYYLPSGDALALKGAWHDRLPFANYKPEDLVAGDCVLLAYADEQGRFCSKSMNNCRLPVNATFDKYSMDNCISPDAWWMQLAYFDANGKLINQDPEPMRYDRLSKEEAKAKVKSYQNMLQNN